MLHFLLSNLSHSLISSFFFFNDTATTEIYTLSLHDALPISGQRLPCAYRVGVAERRRKRPVCHPKDTQHRDRKSTRLNSSHLVISYAVFCLKKKKNRHKKHVTNRQSRSNYTEVCSPEQHTQR